MPVVLPKHPHERIFKVLNEIEVINQPTPTYLIDGLIPENSVCMLSGFRGTYKSFFAIDAALTMTHKLGWFHGHRARKGGAIYLAGEGAGGLGKRLKAWRRYHKKDMIEQPSPFWLIRQPINILDDDDVEMLIRTVKVLEREHGEEFISMWMDTVSRGLQGAKEDEQGWGKLIMNAERIKEEIGHAMSFIGIAHHGKVKEAGIRGSSVAEANADNVLSLFSEKDQTPDMLVLDVTKLKDDEDGQKIHFVTCNVEWDDPNAVSGKSSSLVLLKEEDELPQQKDARIAGRAERLRVNPTKVNKREQNHQTMIDELRVAVASQNMDTYTMSKMAEKVGKSRGRIYDYLKEAIETVLCRVDIGEGRFRTVIRQGSEENGWTITVGLCAGSN